MMKKVIYYQRVLGNSNTASMPKWMMLLWILLVITNMETFHGVVQVLILSLGFAMMIREVTQSKGMIYQLTPATPRFQAVNLYLMNFIYFVIFYLVILLLACIIQLLIAFQNLPNGLAQIMSNIVMLMQNGFFNEELIFLIGLYCMQSMILTTIVYCCKEKKTQMHYMITAFVAMVVAGIAVVNSPFILYGIFISFIVAILLPAAVIVSKKNSR